MCAYGCRRRKAVCGIFTALLALLLALPARGGDAFPAKRLDIVAVIDQRTELHVSQRSVTCLHQSGSEPTRVEVNGFRWNPRQYPVLTAANNGWLLDPGLELCGAVMHKLSGHGAVDLSCDATGLVLSFDNAGSGPETVEVEVSFAQVLAGNTNLATNDLELRLKARITGNEEIWLDRDKAKWVHTWSDPPTDVTINGQVWNVATHPALDLKPALLPELMDLQRATLTRVVGRGIVNLEYEDERLCLDLEDPEPGADEYEAVVRVPRIGRRHLVRLTAAAPDLLTGAPLKIYRFPAPGEKRPQFSRCGFPTALSSSRHPAVGENSPNYPRIESPNQRGNSNRAALDSLAPSEGERAGVRGFHGEPYALLPGQRCLDSRGQCLVALEPGHYQFEVLYQPRTNLLVALKSEVLEISSATNVDLKVQRIEPQFYGPGNRRFQLDDLRVNSVWPNGSLAWKASADSNAPPPSMLISAGQSYQVHAFGHAGADYAAAWTTAAAASLTNLALEPDQWRSCAIHWLPGTPRANDKGVSLQFPDGQLEIPGNGRFFSNRRFFNVTYWLAFDAGHKAVFQPRDFVLPANGDGELALGGPLRPRASAQVFDDRTVRPDGAKHLWWELTLADAQNYLLDTAASTIDWKPALTSPDGRPISTAPLLPEDVRRLGNLRDTLIASASYSLDGPQHIAVHPESFATYRTPHFFTRLPPYRDWNTRAYLAKMERELEMIARAREQPLRPNLRFDLRFWLTEGLSIGGGNSVLMPFSEYLECRDWFSHPWALAHEMLHNFGYGHSREMNRLDHDVQEQMARFEWSVAAHPEYAPEPSPITMVKVELELVKVDCEETVNEDGHGENAVDGNPRTYWHTRWQGDSPGLPHEIVLKLTPPRVIKGFGYLPRQDESDHGTIKNYEFYVSNNGENFGDPVKQGTFASGKGEKIETFAPIKCGFIKLKALSEINGLPLTSAAEIRVIQ